MKHVLLAGLGAMLLVPLACGDLTGADELSISDLRLSANAAYLNEGDGEISCVGRVDFVAPWGDLSFISFVLLDENGDMTQWVTVPIRDQRGETSGSTGAAFTIPTTRLGDIRIRVYVTDSSYEDSNTLETVFRIQPFPWVLKTTMPTERDWFATANLNGKIYVIGGRDVLVGGTAKPALPTVEIYDAATDSWSTAPSLPVPAAKHMAGVANGRIYAFGGEDGPGTTDAVYEYDPGSRTWASRSGMPEGRETAAVATIGDRIHVAAGQGPSSYVTSTLFLYDTTTDAWTSGPRMVVARDGAGGAAIDGRFVVYGGSASLQSDYIGSVEIYDPAADQWSSLRDGPTPDHEYGRRDHGVAVLDGILYAFGGNGTTRAVDTVTAYDVAADQWRLLTPVPTKLGAARAEVVGDRIYVFGASDSTITYEYTPANDLEAR